MLLGDDKKKRKEMSMAALSVHTLFHFPSCSTDKSEIESEKLFRERVFFNE